MARRYKKGDVVRKAVDRTVTVLGYWNGNVILEDNGSPSGDLICYSENDVEEVYGSGIVHEAPFYGKATR